MTTPTVPLRFREARGGQSFYWVCDPSGCQYEKTGPHTYRLLNWQDGTPVPGMSYNLRESAYYDRLIMPTTYRPGVPVTAVTSGEYPGTWNVFTADEMTARVHAGPWSPEMRVWHTARYGTPVPV